ncbi:MAG: adenylate/guanylate cyclase domain-containing protein, partial [Rhodococcus sp.]|nr:adenylate/guanylate cyclase domain-containing protein [Rhodococcus sp. (in: high G+C Gram-positive bacteria)]
MDPPGVRYVSRNGHALAYQVVSNAASDSVRNVVWYLEIALHPDIMWTDPHIHYLFERGSTFYRSVYFQRRGIGMSDPVDHVPTLEEQADDVAAVMDDAGMSRATLVGIGSTCGPLTMFAARSPERAENLVLVQPFAERILDNPTAYGWTDGEREWIIHAWRLAGERWGIGDSARLWDPELHTGHNRRLMAMLERCSATPEA